MKLLNDEFLKNLRIEIPDAAALRSDFPQTTA
jgi:hypothetical protein